ncbi:hypothetical protein AAG570_001799 [Ranatra chinensis]|uniref:Uncharacterized protein n=1 Tax=Ranatra chinensis TaxID=642074 RepID=A0ABD0YAE7_9HEMI
MFCKNKKWETTEIAEMCGKSQAAFSPGLDDRGPPISWSRHYLAIKTSTPPLLQAYPRPASRHLIPRGLCHRVPEGRTKTEEAAAAFCSPGFRRPGDPEVGVHLTSRPVSVDGMVDYRRGLQDIRIFSGNRPLMMESKLPNVFNRGDERDQCTS